MVSLRVCDNTDRTIDLNIGKRVKLNTDNGLVESNIGQVAMNFRHMSGCDYIHRVFGSDDLSFRIDKTGSIKAVYFTFGIEPSASLRAGDNKVVGTKKKGFEFVLLVNDEVIDINEELAVFNMIGYAEGVYDIDSKYITAMYAVNKHTFIGNTMVTVVLKCEQGFDKL